MYTWANAEHSIILKDDDGANIVATEDNRDYRKVLAWIDAGNTPTPYQAPQPSADDYAAAIQAHLEQTARARGYNDALTCVSYISSVNPTWSAEADAFRYWRDQTWNAAFTALAAVTAGERPQPSIADFIAELPPMEWPS